MGLSVLFGGVVVAISVSGLTVWGLAVLLSTTGVVDVPNTRSSHTKPVPRIGGLGLVTGLVVGAAVLRMDGWCGVSIWLCLATAMVGLIGLIDDLRGGLPIVLRFLVQTGAALAVACKVGALPRVPLPPPLDFPLGGLAIPITLIWVVGVTNIYNFLDGIDGLAGLQAVVVGVCVGYAFVGSGGATVGWLVAAAAAGFLIWNWSPARIFMGDVGSTTLGFLFASLPLAMPSDKIPEAVWVMGIALWFFLSDGVFTILRRVGRGERFWAAHRSHLYQRLVLVGYSHAEVVVMTMIPATVLAGAASWVEWKQAGTEWMWMISGLAFVAFLCYLGLVLLIEQRVRLKLGE